MSYNRLLAVGWDVGGWMGDNHGFSIIQWDFADNDYKWLGNPVELTIPHKSTFSLEYIIEEVTEEQNIDIDDYEIVIGIDAPLQFPKKFKDFLNGNLHKFERPEKEIYNELAYRKTDKHIYEKFGKKPLSAVFDRLGTNCTVAMVHVRKWVEKYEFSVPPVLDNKESKNIIEVYPALLKESKYSAAFNPLKEMLPPELERGTDAYDSALCSIMALAFIAKGKLQGLPPLIGPGKVTAEIREEGWIYYFPSDFLEGSGE